MGRLDECCNTEWLLHKNIKDSHKPPSTLKVLRSLGTLGSDVLNWGSVFSFPPSAPPSSYTAERIPLWTSEAFELPWVKSFHSMSSVECFFNSLVPGTFYRINFISFYHLNISLGAQTMFTILPSSLTQLVDSERSFKSLPLTQQRAYGSGMVWNTVPQPSSLWEAMVTPICWQVFSAGDIGC